MLSFSCAGLDTFETSVSLTLAVPASVASFSIGVFDGDTGGVDGAGLGHWDLGARQLRYRLYFDPLAEGNTSPADLVAEWTGNDPNPLSNPDPNPEKAWTVDAAAMLDNGWWNATVVSSALAQAPSGNRFYHLAIESDGACDPGEELASDLKLAASAPMSFVMAQFGFEASFRQSANDAPIIYPDWPPSSPTFFLDSPTTYDGTFEFFLNVRDNRVDLEVFDGDFDQGATNLVGIPSGVTLDVCADVDDANTAADYSGFPAVFNPSGALPEGVGAPGDPPDDNEFDAFRRGYLGDPDARGCVRYELIDPTGAVYRNANPSGSQEWERFRIATAQAPNPNTADYGPAVAADGVTFVTGDSLPAGIWRVRIEGLDLANLNFWLMDEVCAVRDGQAACNPPVYLVGDTVFTDGDGDGVQGPGEAGIAGVVVNLLDGPGGEVLRTAVTGDTSAPDWADCVAANTGLDTDGLYCFGVNDPASYTAEIDPSNFAPGGVLEGLSSTTGGEEATDTLIAGANLLTLDFGYQVAGRIGDRVWLDFDGDGVQDAGEPGIEGALVEVFDFTFNSVGSAVTDVNGDYEITGLAAGDYIVFVDEFTLPPRLEATFDFDGIFTPFEAEVSLGPGEENLEVDFGFRGPGSIGDLVWSDSDGDGTFDAGESGIGGVTVDLTGAGADGVLGTGDDEAFPGEVTDTSGGYLFSGLPAGLYRVDVDDTTVPAGLSLTTANDPLDARVGFPELGFPNEFLSADFGYNAPVGSIGDRVWLDFDGDGAQDAGEPGIAGALVELLDLSFTPVASATTDGAGNYLFANVPPGDYLVFVDELTLPARVDPTFDFDGIATPFEAQVSLSAGEDNLAVDFGFRGLGSIGDLVWEDSNGNGAFDAGEPGIGGVVVNLTAAGGDGVFGTGDDVAYPPRVTDASGGYLFTGLPAGVYRVDVDDATVPAGLALSTANDPLDVRIGFPDLGFPDSFLDADFGYAPPLGSIGDRVWEDSNADGLQDAGEPGLNGITVNLLDTGGAVVATAVTSGDGGYLFENLAAGDYTVEVDASTLPAGYTPTFDLDGVATADRASLTLAAGEDRTEVDFGYVGPGSIGDRLWDDEDGDGVQDAGEAGLNGVTVILRDSAGAMVATVVTSGDGGYSFDSLTRGDYTVEVDASTLPAGFVPTFDLDGLGSPNLATLSLGPGEDRTDVDFGYVGRSSIGDRVWDDVDGNGVQDAGEVGLNGVTVILRDSTGTVIATAMTSGDGGYTFADLAADDYTVEVDASTLPAGSVPTFDADGVATPNAAAVTLAAGEDRTDVDFGYRTEVVGCPDRVADDLVALYVFDEGSGTVVGDSSGFGAPLDLTIGDLGSVSWLPTGGLSIGSPTIVQSAAAASKIIDEAKASGELTVEAWLRPANATQGGPARIVSISQGSSLRNVTFAQQGVEWSTRFRTSSDFDGRPETESAGVLAGAVQHVVFTHDAAGAETYFVDGAQTATASRAGATSNWDDAFQLALANENGASRPWLGDLFVVAIYRRALDASEVATNRESGLCNGVGGQGTGAIGDRVWFDENSNGVQDAGETGLNGATVRLLDAGGSEIASATTAGDGNYSFTGLPVGVYTVVVEDSTVPLESAVQTFDLDGLGTPNAATVVLGPGGVNNDVDFGYDGDGQTCPSRVSRDLVALYVFDEGSGSVVSDSSGVGSALDLNIADPSNVSWLPLGGLSVLSPTVIQSAAAASKVIDAAKASDELTVEAWLRPANSTQGGPARIVSVSQGSSLRNFTFAQQGAQWSTRFRTSSDGDGLPETASAGLLAGEVQHVVFTHGASGAETYFVDGVQTSSATRTGSTSNWDDAFRLALANENDAPRPWLGDLFVVAIYNRALDGAEVALNRESGLCNGTGGQGTGAIGDRVWFDDDGDGVQDAGEDGLDGVTVRLLDDGGVEIDSAITSGGGAYSFTQLPPGDYTVAVDATTVPLDSGFPTFDFDGLGTPNEATVTLAPGEVNNDVDFGYDGDGLSCPVRVSQDLVALYAFTEGSGALAADSSGVGLPLDLAIGDPSSVSWLPLGGLSVDAPTILQSAAAATKIIDAAKASGELTVEVWLRAANATQGGPARIVSVSEGSSLRNFTFAQQGSEWSSRLRTSSDGDGRPETESAGVLAGEVQHVVFTHAADGLESYFVDGAQTATAMRPGSTSNWDDTFRLALANENDAPRPWLGDLFLVAIYNRALDSGEIALNRESGLCNGTGGQGTGAIGDRLWFDEDADGVQDAGEVGINGVTVNLRDASGNLLTSTVTSGDGIYGFDRLPPGTFIVEVDATTLPSIAGAPTFDVDGTATPNVAVVTLGVGEVTDVVDFGYEGSVGDLSSIGDRVWDDSAGPDGFPNGVQDAGEPGIAGVSVSLLDDTGAVIASTATNAAGEYSFDLLSAASYSVRVDSSNFAAGGALEGFSPTLRDAGPDDVDSDGDTVTYTTDVITLAPATFDDTRDFGFYTVSRYEPSCPAPGGAGRVIEILGMGMGSGAGVTNNPATLAVPDVGSMERILAYVVVKRCCGISKPSKVILSSALETIELLEPHFSGTYTATYAAYMLPTGDITAEVVNNGARSPRAFQAFVFRQTADSAQTARFEPIYADIYRSSESVDFDLPVTAGLRDVEIVFPVADLESDSRTVMLSAVAGGVTAQSTYSLPNRGDELLIDALFLPGVPGSADRVTFTVTSPSSGGDSVVTAGVGVNTRCVAAP